MINEAAVWVEVPFEVQKPHDGLRLDSFLASRLHRYSRCQVQHLIEQGRVFLRGRCPKPAARVASGLEVGTKIPVKQALRGIKELAAAAGDAAALGRPWPVDRLSRALRTWIGGARPG